MKAIILLTFLLLGIDAVPLANSCSYDISPGFTATDDLYCGTDADLEKLDCQGGKCLGTYLYSGCSAGKCAAGFYCSSVGVCQACSTGCGICSSSDKCTYCYEGFNLVDEACTPVTEAHCLRSDENGCTECDSGFYKDADGVCQSCPAGCSSCTAENTCDVAGCGIGKYWDETAQECAPGIANCISATSATTCDFCNFGTYKYVNPITEEITCIEGPASCLYVYPTGFCDACTVNYYWSEEDQLCKKMDVDYCLTTTTGADCTKCYDYYFLEYACSDMIPNCAIASSATTCEKCVDGYYPDNEMDPVCQECYDTAACATCTSNKKSDCSTCQAGYVNYATYKCQACSTGCETCTSKEATACESCLTGYFHDSEEKTCTKCIAHCDDCSDATSCNDGGCESGYEMTSEGNLCTKCGGAGCADCQLSGCKTAAEGYFIKSGIATSCTNIGGSCETCDAAKGCTKAAAGSYLDANVATACPTRCTTCTSASKCTSCDANYFVSGGSCISCGAGCLDCDNTNTALGCKDADDGYYIVSKVSTKCPDKYDTCTSTGGYGTCATGYFIRDNDCIACGEIAGACVNGQCDRNAEDGCEQAAAGYFIKEGVAISCGGLTRCAECTENGCVLPVYGHFIKDKIAYPIAGTGAECMKWDTVDGCTEAGVGSYIDDGTAYVCTNGCATCTSATDCLTCAEGYYVSSGTICTSCENCGSCSGNTCTQKAGFYVDANVAIACSSPCTECNSATVCTACEAGFVLLDNKCIAQSEFDGCDSWGDHECDTETSGYFIDSNGVPQQCPTNCAICDNRATCTTCTAEYFLKGGVCVSATSAECSNYDTTGCTTVSATTHYIQHGLVATCPTGCSACNPTTGACTDCPTDYFLKSGRCVTCGDMDGCDTGNGGICDSTTSNGCDAPLDGYFKDTDGTLFKCPTGCDTCTSLTICQTCITGYTHDPDTNVCYITCDDTVGTGNCDTCTAGVCGTPASGYFKKADDRLYPCADTGASCTTCTAAGCTDDPAPEGFYVKAGTMTALPAHCTEGSQTAGCGTCEADYYARDGICVSLGEEAGACKTDTATGCDEANPGYYKVDNYAVKCPDNCAECSDATTCTACAESYILLTDICVPCTYGTADISSCNTCPDTGCTVTVDGYYLKSGVRLPCQDNCKTCDASTGVCSECNEGYFYRYGICTACSSEVGACGGDCTTSGCTSGATGFYVVDGVAVPCSTSSAGCEECLADGTCTKCDTDTHYLNDEGSCSEQTSADCFLWSAGSCSTPQSGYYVDGGKPYPCMDECDTCSDGTTCDTCPDLFYKNSLGRCVSCTGCSNCQAESCGAVEDGYFLVGTEHFSCGDDCTECDPADGCIKVGGLGAFVKNNIAYGCAEGDGVCTECHDTNGCQAAATGSYLENGVAKACPTECTACTAANTCTGCITQYSLINGVCTSCGGDTYCETCTATGGCTKAKDGAYLDGKVAKACSTGCDTCSAYSTCKSCKAGKFLSGTLCVSCGGYGCLDCSTTDGCQEARDGYYLGNKAAISCPTGCSLCNSATVCTECSDGYYLDGTACKQPENCLSHTDLETCTECKSGYFLAEDVNGDPLNMPCAKCRIENCAKCSSALVDECEKCMPGYFLSTDKTSCGASVCTDDCFECATESTCKKCNPGFFETTEGGCDSCYSSDACATCADGTELAKCTTCNIGYYYIKDKGCFICDDSGSAGMVATCDAPPKDKVGEVIPTAKTKAKTCMPGSFATNVCSGPVASCTTLTSSTSCSACAKGTFLAEDYTCSACDIGGCYDCPSEGKCNGCYPGKYLETVDGVIKCTTCPQDNCAACNSGADAACTICNRGYKIESGVCSECDATSGATECHCYDAEYWDQETSACKACITGCSTCDNGETCLECSFGYYKDPNENVCIEVTDDKCATAKPLGICGTCAPTTYYNAEANTCDDCATAFENCKICTAEKCTLCKTGYFTKDGACSRCTDENCAACTTETTCDQCIDAHYFDTTEKKCMACMDGCVACSKKTTCEMCEEGFKMDDDDACFKCADGCKTCDNNENCTTCFDGFYYNNVTEKCDPCDPICTLCTNATASDCQGCIENATITGSTCACKVGYTFDSTKKMCVVAATSSSAVYVFTGLLTMLVVLLAIF